MIERRGDDPIEYVKTRVKVRGEAPSRILWRGRQWAVTEYGLEALDGRYPIEARRLCENIRTENYGGWPAHMTQKVWVDSDDFCTAYLIALALHGFVAFRKDDKAAEVVRAAIAESTPQVCDGGDDCTHKVHAEHQRAPT